MSNRRKEIFFCGSFQPKTAQIRLVKLGTLDIFLVVFLVGRNFKTVRSGFVNKHKPGHTSSELIDPIQEEGNNEMIPTAIEDSTTESPNKSGIAPKEMLSGSTESTANKVIGDSSEVIASTGVKTPNLADVLSEPRNIKGDVNLNLKWYVLHTYSGFEEKAKFTLLTRAKERNLESLVGIIHVPQQSHESKTRTGKVKLTSRTSFPGYVIAQIELNDSTKLLIKETPKITGFVGDSRNPRPLPDSEVRTLLAIESPLIDVKTSVVEVVPVFNKGDSVKVKDGPFTNFDGVIDVVRAEKSKARVLVSIFGRETPVELDFKQIERI